MDCYSQKQDWHNYVSCQNEAYHAFNAPQESYGYVQEGYVAYPQPSYYDQCQQNWPYQDPAQQDQPNVSSCSSPEDVVQPTMMTAPDEVHHWQQNWAQVPAPSPEFFHVPQPTPSSSSPLGTPSYNGSGSVEEYAPIVDWGQQQQYGQTMPYFQPPRPPPTPSPSNSLGTPSHSSHGSDEDEDLKKSRSNPVVIFESSNSTSALIGGALIDYSDDWKFQRAIKFGKVQIVIERLLMSLLGDDLSGYNLKGYQFKRCPDARTRRVENAKMKIPDEVFHGVYEFLAQRITTPVTDLKKKVARWMSKVCQKHTDLKKKKSLNKKKK